MKYYCKHCGKLISPTEFVPSIVREGTPGDFPLEPSVLSIGFTYHYRCYAAIYGNFND